MKTRVRNRGLGAASFLAATLLASAAAAVTFDVRWDDPLFGGYGVSAATAESARLAGIRIRPIGNLGLKPGDLAVNHDLDESTVALPTPIGSAPATARSNWSATNNTGANDGSRTPEELFLIFATVLDHQIEVNGQPQNVHYDPSDVGLTLRSGEGGVDWEILRFDFDDGSVYYPAVSLGTLANGSAAGFPLDYTLEINPQDHFFLEETNFELGMPQWNLYFTSIVIPEPSTALLVLAGLGGLAAVRRRRP